MIRGDAAEEALLARAREIVSERRIQFEADLEALFVEPRPSGDAESLKRLRQMFEVGGWVLVESTLADLPADLRWLYESGAVTLAQLGVLNREVGATSLADLRAAVREQRLRDIAGLDERTEAAVMTALSTLRAMVPRIPLGRAVALADPLLARLRKVSGVTWALPSGSLRRGDEMVGDLELIAATAEPARAIDALLQIPEVIRCLLRSERRLYVRIDRVQVGIRFPEPANAGADLLYLTGSQTHFELLQRRAATRGFRLTSEGLFVLDGSMRPARTEDELYAALGLPCIPPEIRNGNGEIDAADHGTLPGLVSRGEIRGDLHMHTDWSDGHDSIEAMVQACRALGYQYMAITDHSPNSAAGRNLTADGVKKQAEEIALLRERYPDIAILHGCEVDILPDGSLDFPDRILEGLDIVLASLHEAAGNSREELMGRYIAAMKHPLVTLITHPTNRLLPYRAGYDLDYDRLFAFAVETGTVVEVDGSPSHLDLDGALARRAIAAGATLSVDSDCHRAELLERQMRLAIVTARRGWVEPRHVLNTRPLEEIRALIASKRASH
jgi:DNA polymerase (family 10)